MIYFGIGHAEAAEPALGQDSGHRGSADLNQQHHKQRGVEHMGEVIEQSQCPLGTPAAFIGASRNADPGDAYQCRLRRSQDDCDEKQHHEEGD